jgi:biopolymer transport protein ExbD
VKGRLSHHLAEAEINLTPLIDLCFVILVMFIVIAPLLEMDRVTLADAPSDPEHTRTAIQGSSPITIHVYSDNTIAVNQQSIPLLKLQEVLRVAREHYPTVRPQVFHDQNARFGTYQSVKNAIESAGFTEMDLILNPQ